MSGGHVFRLCLYINWYHKEIPLSRKDIINSCVWFAENINQHIHVMIDTKSKPWKGRKTTFSPIFVYTFIIQLLVVSSALLT